MGQTKAHTVKFIKKKLPFPLVDLVFIVVRLQYTLFFSFHLQRVKPVSHQFTSSASDDDDKEGSELSMANSLADIEQEYQNFIAETRARFPYTSTIATRDTSVSRQDTNPSRRDTNSSRRVVDEKDDDELTRSQRKHESLAGRVKDLLARRMEERVEMATSRNTPIHSLGEHLYSTDHAHSRPRTPLVESSPEITRDYQTSQNGRDCDDFNSPISDVHGQLIPHPPGTPHIVIAHRVYAYRERRFELATLLKKRAC